MDASSAEITNLLKAWSGGDPAALERLAEQVYPELRRMARRYMKNERPGNTLQATALVHAEAAAEFQKIVDHKGANWGATWVHPYWGQFYSLSYLGIARGFALAGDTAKAKKAFQDFFGLWKDAEPDIPILQQAKAEHAELR